MVFQYILLFFVLRNALQVTQLALSTHSASTSRAAWSILCLYLLYTHKLFPGLTRALLWLYQIHKCTTKLRKPCLETTVHHGLSLSGYNLIQTAFKSWEYTRQRIHWTQPQSLGPVLAVCSGVCEFKWGSTHFLFELFHQLIPPGWIPRV